MTATACGGSLQSARTSSTGVRANTVARAVLIGSRSLEIPDVRPRCTLTETTVGASFTDQEYDCDAAVHCGVESDILIDQQPTTFFYCTRPTGDSFSVSEVCVLQAAGRMWVDSARNSALTLGDYFPCPYHWEDAPDAWGDDHP